VIEHWNCIFKPCKPVWFNRPGKAYELVFIHITIMVGGNRYFGTYHFTDFSDSCSHEFKPFICNLDLSEGVFGIIITHILLNACLGYRSWSCGGTLSSSLCLLGGGCRAWLSVSPEIIFYQRYRVLFCGC